MNARNTPLPRRLAGWLLGFALLLAGLNAAAQQDPPGRVGRINLQQGTVSFSPAGDDNWYQADPNRPLTSGDRLWTDRGSRAELFVGSTAVRLDEQTAITLSELDDDTLRITATQGELQLRVRDPLAGQRVEIGTANAAAVVNGPGDYRIDTDPSGDTTHVAVAAGNLTLYGENGEALTLEARQQLAVTGRNLAEAGGLAPRGSGDFDRWVAERDRIDDQSISARYVSREVPGYQQLDAYGDWQSDPTYGEVWYPRGVDAGWAPYQNGQWVEVAPWGWTWIDAAPWGFAPAHYGRWARIGPRWGWVPGRHHARPVYAPALVGFVGGTAGANLAIAGGRQGVGWFPLAPGETWRPGYRASQRYIDAANQAAYRRPPPSHNVAFANRRTPGAITVVPVEMFGSAPVGRRSVVPVPYERVVGAPVGMGAPVPLREHRGGHFGRPGTPPPAAIQAAQQQQLQQALQVQQLQRRQVEMQQRAAAQVMQAQGQQAQQVQQAQRQQFEAQQRAAAQAVQAQQQAQQQVQQRAAVQAQQVQQAQRQQIEAQQRAAAAQAQQVQQAQRQQVEAQQRAAAAQAQQAQQIQRQQQEVQQRAAAQAQAQAAQAQELQRRQMDAQQRAVQAQALQAQQMQRQQQEAQQRAAAQAMQAQQQRQQMEAQQRAAAQAMQAQQAQQMQRQQQMEMQQRAAQAQAQQMQQIQQQQQAAMRAQQQQAQQMMQAQQQQAMRQAQEARQRGMGRPNQDPGQPDRP